MKAIVDPNLCIGCTQCAGLCPEVFSMDGTLAVAIPGDIPGEDVPQGSLPGRRHQHRPVSAPAPPGKAGRGRFLPCGLSPWAFLCYTKR